jgi:hypothetical protein
MEEKEKADDWCYIVDNSIRIENRKLCLILGVRLSTLEKEGYLKFEDMSILELGLIPGKAKEGVMVLLESAISKTGVPLEICSDQGPDIMPAVREIQSKYPSVKHVPDAIHATTNILKKLLETNWSWEEFTKKVAAEKNKLKHSSLSELCPPQIRGKSRFLNCGVVVDWGLKVIKLMESAECTAEMKSKLGWLFEFKKDLSAIKEMITIVGIANELVRKHRIVSTTWSTAEMLFKKEAKTKMGKQLSKEIVKFLKTVSGLAGKGILIGSSEIIESAFGKLKTLDRECGNSGFTSSILGIGACFGKLDFEQVKEAMEKISDKDVEKWKIEKVGETQQSKRRKLLKTEKLESFEQKLTRIIERERAVA